jgi:hypothetical protein
MCRPWSAAVSRPASYVLGISVDCCGLQEFADWVVMVEISDRWLYLYRKGEGCRVLCMLARIDSERGAKRARERQVFLSLINREW